MTSHHVTMTSCCQNSRHLGSAVLDFKIFLKLQKTAQNNCKVLKTNQIVLKNREKVKIITLKLFFIYRNTKITNLGKHACQNTVAIVMSSS